MNCDTCHGAGFIAGTRDRPYAWCQCPAGERERAKRPGMVDEMNQKCEEALRQRAMSEKGYLPQRKGSAA